MTYYTIEFQSGPHGKTNKVRVRGIDNLAAVHSILAASELRWIIFARQDGDEQSGEPEKVMLMADSGHIPF